MDAPRTQLEPRRGLADGVVAPARVSTPHLEPCQATPANICTVVSSEALRLALRRQAVGRG